jgi:hypothetical protein
MARILVAECKQEVSTFNPHESTYDDFDTRSGAALFGYHRTVRNEVGGVLDVLESTPGVEAVPTYRSLMVHYDPVAIGFDAVADLLLGLAASAPALPATTARATSDGRIGARATESQTALKPQLFVQDLVQVGRVPDVQRWSAISSNSL